MNIGFSTLALFNKNNQEIVEIARGNDFDMIELLSEGPFYRNKIESLKDFSTFIHAPTVDLNIASINKGIREESVLQIKNVIDMGELIDAEVITVHPGRIGRNDDKLRKLAVEIAIESVSELVDYSDLVISVENMPNNSSFLANRIDEIEYISEQSGCMITIDTGHANTCSECDDFFNLKNISYFHINDNNGCKDQHLTLGEGTLDLNLIKKIDNGIIELNNFDNVLKSKEVIFSL